MGSELALVLRHLLGRAPRVSALEHLDAWWSSHLKVGGDYHASVSRAFVGGFGSDRLGYAFLSGYQEAIASIVPSLRGVRCAFCVTEGGGASADAIDTTFEFRDGAYFATGTKSFVTMGQAAEELLIVGHVGRDDHERKRLRVARLPVAREGMEHRDGRVMPFAPEIGSSTLTLENVRISSDEMLEGDGYDGFVKPFRTAEDLHVAAAVVGHLLRLGRLYGWGPEELEALSALACTIFPLALADPQDAAVHIAASGMLRRLDAQIASLPWSSVERAEAQRFERDRPLLQLAKGVRAARLRSAWRRLGQEAGPKRPS